MVWGQAAVQGDAGEDLQLDAALQGQALDAVEAVQLGPAAGELGQVPAPWRGRAAHTAVAVQRAAAREDQADGAQGRRVGPAAGQPLPVDGRRTDLAQVAVAQLLAELHVAVLAGGVGAVDRAGQAARAVGPIDAVEALATGACQPVLHGGQGDAELAGDAPQGGAAARGLDHGTSALGGSVF